MFHLTAIKTLSISGIQLIQVIRPDHKACVAPPIQCYVFSTMVYMDFVFSSLIELEQYLMEGMRLYMLQVNNITNGY